MPLEESRQPFIFMNAAGVQRDVETLLHEGGHAFHYLATASDRSSFLYAAARHGILRSRQHVDGTAGGRSSRRFITRADAARATTQPCIEGIIRLLALDHYASIRSSTGSTLIPATAGTIAKSSGSA